MIKLHYKNYCSILKRVIREAKKVYFKNLTEISGNKAKTMKAKDPSGHDGISTKTLKICNSLISKHLS